jgi:xanthine dehydrogenase small subunit
MSVFTFKRIIMRNKVIFYLNGTRHQVGPDKSKMMLAEYLRYDQALTGTKIVCSEGDCGACSVLRYFPHIDGAENNNYIAINSCITLVANLDASSLITVDHLQRGDELHETQRAMLENHGSQCGFCTPGLVMSLAAIVEKKLARNETSITEKEAKNAMTGNLCRCTGYCSIIDAAKDIDLHKCQSLKERFYSKEQAADLREAFKTSVAMEDAGFRYFAPSTINEATAFYNDHSDVKIIASSTDLGVVHNKRKLKLTNLLSLHLVKELYEIKETDGNIIVGARVSLTEFRHYLKHNIKEFAHYLDVFASPQIKNIATVVGNVANASPIGDLPPALLAIRANAIIKGPTAQRIIALEDFFLDYRKTDLKSNEIITAISFEKPDKNLFIRLFKNSNRKDLDISAVNLALVYNNVFTIAAGGVAAIPLRLKKTEDFLNQNTLSQSTIEDAVKVLHAEFTPLSDVRASSSYRHILIENYFRRALKQLIKKKEVSE